MRFPYALLLCAGITALLSQAGCALNTRNNAADRDCAAGLTPADNTRLATIGQLVDERKPYAALAELDQLASDAPKARLMRANALRQIDRRQDAATQYNALLDTCLAGQAHHGLGLLAAQDGRTTDALNALHRARQLQPTDIRVRNDHGYALLLAKRWDDAQFEFLTVLDLQPNEPRASRNLVLLALLQDKSELARQLAERMKLDADAMARLQRQAQSLRSPSPPGAEGANAGIFGPAVPKAPGAPLDTGRTSPMIPPTDAKSLTP